MRVSLLRCCMLLFRLCFLRETADFPLMGTRNGQTWSEFGKDCHSCLRIRRPRPCPCSRASSSDALFRQGLPTARLELGLVPLMEVIQPARLRSRPAGLADRPGWFPSYCPLCQALARPDGMAGQLSCATAFQIRHGDPLLRPQGQFSRDAAVQPLYQRVPAGRRRAAPHMPRRYRGFQTCDRVGRSPFHSPLGMCLENGQIGHWPHPRTNKCRKALTDCRGTGSG